MRYSDVFNKAYDGIIDAFRFVNDGYIVIGNVYVGTDIESSTYEYCITRKKIKNDLHRVGAFVLKCKEMERLIQL